MIHSLKIDFAISTTSETLKSDSLNTDHNIQPWRKFIPNLKTIMKIIQKSQVTTHAWRHIHNPWIPTKHRSSIHSLIKLGHDAWRIEDFEITSQTSATITENIFQITNLQETSYLNRTPIGPLYFDESGLIFGVPDQRSTSRKTL